MQFARKYKPQHSQSLPKVESIIKLAGWQVYCHAKSFKNHSGRHGPVIAKIVRKNLNPLAKNVKGDSNSLFATLLVGKGKTNPQREIVACVPPHSGGVIAKKMSANTVEKPELSSNHIEETRQNRFGSRPPRFGGTDNMPKWWNGRHSCLKHNRLISVSVRVRFSAPKVSLPYK